jgi:hypothetical protein
VGLLVESPPSFLTFPCIGCKERLGIDETIIEPKDMTSTDAYISLWLQLHNKVEQGLDEPDFRDIDLYHKFFLWSLGLLEYPMVLIGGDVGKGKSLVRTWLTIMQMKFFHKNACMDSPPPEPELYEKYGRLHNLYDQDYINLIVEQLKELSDLQRTISNTRDAAEREILRAKFKAKLNGMILYRTEGSYDEAHMWGDNSRTFNLTVLISRIAIIRRHLYMGMYFNYVNPRKANKLIWDIHTHEIECLKDAFPEYGPGVCSFAITDLRTNVSKWLHLKPKEWEGYWDSENIPTVVHDVEIYLGGKKKKKLNKSDWDEITVSPGV